jgi:prevent-host-death family protein
MKLVMARTSGYYKNMDVSIAEAKDRLPELIRAVEDGEKVVITRDGKPVAQIAPPPPERRKARFETMKDRIKLLPGWDDPIDEDRFLAGDL